MKKVLLVVVCVCSSAMYVPAQLESRLKRFPAPQTVAATNPLAGTMTNADIFFMAGLNLSDDIVIAKFAAPNLPILTRAFRVDCHLTPLRYLMM